jgi:hypothetical protein
MESKEQLELDSTNLGAPDKQSRRNGVVFSIRKLCVERAGYASTDSAAAPSWDCWGSSSTSAPVPGDIVVFNWGGGHGHVGLFDSASAGKVTVFCGNQSNAITTS